MRKWDCTYPCPLQRLSLDGNSSCLEPRDWHQGWQMLPGILPLQLCVKCCPVTKTYIFCCLAKSGELFLRFKSYFLNSGGPWRTKHVLHTVYALLEMQPSPELSDTPLLVSNNAAILLWNNDNFRHYTVVFYYSWQFYSSFSNPSLLF